MAFCQLILIVTFVAHITLQQSHHHSHNSEPPHYKYSRAANQKEPEYNKRSDHHEHGHAHDGLGHEHAHDGHGHEHAHDGHGHEHAHDGHGHEHAHDGHGHEHGHTHNGDEHACEHHHSRPQKNSGSGSPIEHIAINKKTVNDFKPYDSDSVLSFLNDFRTRLWVYSIGSTILISIAPFVILSLIPVQANTAENEPTLKVLLSFGSGGLLGDAFLHLIPHAQPAGQHDHTHSHSHAHGGSGHPHGGHEMNVGSYVLAGIITFLTVEKLVRIMRSKQLIHSHSHFHSHDSDTVEIKKSEKKKGKKKSRTGKDKRSDTSSTEESSQCQSVEEKRHLSEKISESVTEFKVAAYLNMAADFTHNFTDGLAIGASYLAGTTVGVVTTATVLVHEVPHEIGDFAILVQSGFSKRRAMFVQLLTALGALTGCVLSLCASNASELSDAASSSWILPFTAGGFIYIATVSVIPEILENTSAWQSVKEVTALLLGILLMYLIAIFE